MYRVKFNPASSCESADITLTLAGCPESGLGAIDFRRAHGIESQPTNQVRLACDFESETICRAFPEYLTSNADLDKYSLRNALKWSKSYSDRTAVPYNLEVDADIVGPALGMEHGCDEQVFIAALGHIIKRTIIHKLLKDAEQVAAAAREAADKAARRAAVVERVMRVYDSGNLYILDPESPKGVSRFA